MKLFIPHIILFLLCVVSRLLTSIEYIEDFHSLQVIEDTVTFIESTDITKSNYSFFIFLSWLLFKIVGSLPAAYALIGGASVYLIIIFTTKCIRVPVISLEGITVAILIFFNPFIWVMSTSFLPHALGLALTLGALNYLLIQNYRKQNVLWGWLLSGILIGTYAPFILVLAIPAILCIYKRPAYWHLIFYTLIGILIWAMPIILFTRQFDLTSIHSISDHILGGETENVWTIIKNTFTYLWADGFGGYITDRSLLYLPISIGNILFFLFGLMIIIDFDYPRDILLGALAAILLFLVSSVIYQNSLFYQDILNIMIPFIVIAIAYGIIYFLVNFNNLYVKTGIVIYLAFQIWNGIYIARDHLNRSAISQAKQFLKKSDLPDTVTIISTSEINAFLEKQKVKAQYEIYLPESFSDINDSIIVIDNIKIPELKYIQEFRHNKYVNRNNPVLYLHSNFDMITK